MVDADREPGPAADPSALLDRFRAGYLDAGGPPAYLEHFVARVLPCEYGGVEIGIWPAMASGYDTAAQFSPDSWRSARRISAADPTDPYEVGWAVGTWIQLIGVENAGTTSGWPTCWWR